MATLYEELINCPEVDTQVRGFLRQAMRVDITNVSDYYYMGTDQDYWNVPDDFPGMVPPFENMWMEFHAPSYMLSKEHGTVPWDERNPPKIGLLFLTSDEKGKYPTHRWMITAILLTEPSSMIYGGPFLQWYMFLQEDGSLAINPAGDRMMAGHVVGKTLDVITGMAYQKAGVTGQPANQLLDEMVVETIKRGRPFLEVALLAISFMHCNNVQLELVAPPTPPRSAEDKRLNRWPKPPLRYHVLNIKPMRKVIENALADEGSPTTATQRGLHIVRGHFKDYREGKGLFGRWRGRYWFEQTHKGDEAQGVVDKDYRIDEIPGQGE